MEILVDTIDLDEITDALKNYPITGVTSNPSIVKKTAPSSFFSHMKSIRKLIGDDATIHIQVLAKDYEKQLSEANTILSEMGNNIYIKVPVTWSGLRTIRELSNKGYHVTATVVYDEMQAYAAMEAGAEYIAVYVNRIAVNGGNPFLIISNLSKRIVKDNYSCKILGASFRTIQQVRDSIDAGADAVTVPVSILKSSFDNLLIGKAEDDFRNDWIDTFGNDQF